tara:strand:+ start:1602 stop:2804 length:1203 start_codon:yes stop_codon:yes gene_type:complete
MKCFLSFPIVFLLAGIAQGEIQVETDFPGGSGAVTNIDQSTGWIQLDPADHPGKGWRCWWYVRLVGLQPQQTITLDVGNAPWATPDRATYSEDGGKTWVQTGKGVREDKRIRYSLQLNEPTALIAWGPPFVPADSQALVDSLASRNPDATAFSLCETRGGLSTPALRIGKRQHSDVGANRSLIWIQARQHAWESGSSWVCKGLAEWIISDAPEAANLRKQFEIVIVPVMDIDNVQLGAGGKNQKPQDHNRDWSDAPHWNAVAAAQKEIKTAAELGRLAAFIDLHNPGADSVFPYFYVPPQDALSEVAQANLDHFVQAAKAEMVGPLRFTGKTIESGASYDPKAWTRISKNWVANLGTDAISVTLETSWNTAESTTSGYQTVGSQLGKALARHFADHQIAE